MVGREREKEEREREREEGKLTNKNNGVLYAPLSGLAIHHLSHTNAHKHTPGVMKPVESYQAWTEQV